MRQSSVLPGNMRLAVMPSGTMDSQFIMPRFSRLKEATSCTYLWACIRLSCSRFAILGVQSGKFTIPRIQAWLSKGFSPVAAGFDRGQWPPHLYCLWRAVSLLPCLRQGIRAKTGLGLPTANIQVLQRFCSCETHSCQALRSLI